MTPPREEWSLATRRLGRRVLVFDRLDSTNNRAAQLADDPANDGIAILADEQTAGRGQHGRTWLAAPGQSVLLSILLSPPPELCRPAVLTAWAAVAVCAAIHEIIATTPRIKWPNDVLLHDRKVCGILIESIAGRRAGGV
ncbi:MAG: biotin--[acetyl-CoA-carboxylase] ligase, partial [Gemmataceae bacterium]